MCVCCFRFHTNKFGRRTNFKGKPREQTISEMQCINGSRILCNLCAFVVGCFSISGSLSFACYNSYFVGSYVCVTHTEAGVRLIACHSLSQRQRKLILTDHLGPANTHTFNINHIECGGKKMLNAQKCKSIAKQH